MLQLQNRVPATLPSFPAAIMNKQVPKTEEEKRKQPYYTLKPINTKQQTIKEGQTHLALVPKINEISNFPTNC